MLTICQFHGDDVPGSGRRHQPVAHLHAIAEQVHCGPGRTGPDKGRRRHPCQVVGRADSSVACIIEIRHGRNRWKRRTNQPIQLQVEADVRRRGIRLVNFHRDRVHPTDQQVRRNRVGIPRGLFFVTDNGLRTGRVGDRATGHVRAPGFLPIDIDHRTIISNDLQVHACDERSVRDIKRPAEIRRDVLVGGVRAISDDGCLVAISIAQFGRARLPCRIVKRRAIPRRPLVGAVVEIFPDGARRNVGHRGHVVVFDGHGARPRAGGVVVFVWSDRQRDDLVALRQRSHR